MPKQSISPPGRAATRMMLTARNAGGQPPKAAVPAVVISQVEVKLKTKETGNGTVGNA